VADVDLDAVRRRHQEHAHPAVIPWTSEAHGAAERSAADVPALLDEIERIRAETRAQVSHAYDVALRTIAQILRQEIAKQPAANPDYRAAFLDAARFLDETADECEAEDQAVDLAAYPPVDDHQR
jgi:hypothetical protein